LKIWSAPGGGTLAVTRGRYGNCSWGTRLWFR